VVAGLLVTGLAQAIVAAPKRPAWLPPAATLLCGAGLLLDLAWLIDAPGPASLELPIGLPGAVSGAVLALDGLSAWFLLLLFGVGAACTLAAPPARTGPFLPAFIAGMAITLLAGDSFSLLFGFEAMSLASWALVLTHGQEAEVPSAALFYLGMSLFAAACLVGALALLSPADGLLETSFATMRAASPDGWRATAVLALVLLGAGAKAGLAPLHVWLPRAHAAAPAHVSALMSGVMTKVAVYVLIRVLLDLCGPAQPVWWGVPLLVAGAGGAVLGGLRATQEADLKSVLAASTIEHIGLICAGIGVALVARGSDLPPLAALALAGVLLHVLCHGLFKSLLFLAAGAVQHGAGTRQLRLLGGLIHRMPVTAACVLVGAASLAALPPAAGFASEWVLFQAVLTAARSGGVALQTLVAVVAAALALATGLAAAAAVRLVGVAFLGRPRSPRCAVADEASRPERLALQALAGVLLAIGLLPGLVLLPAEPALRLLAGVGLEGRAGLLGIAPQIGMPGYTAAGVAVLLMGLLGGAVMLARRAMVQGMRRGPAWDCGFAAPPAWLPFGDPATQYGAASFAQPLGRMLGGALLARRESAVRPAPASTEAAVHRLTQGDPADRWMFQPLLALRKVLSIRADAMQFLTIRRTLSVMFTLLVLLLAIVAWVEA
jgi:formate hydrogenlyase subunit 3/multisubunit Na+/H+ antiporter MnhD subunit